MTVDRPDQHWQDTQPSAPLDRRQLAGYAALGAVGAALMIAAWLADLSWLLFVLELFLDWLDGHEVVESAEAILRGVAPGGGRR